MVKVEEKSSPQDFLKFLGTAGARFVMIKQLRSSGGIWISYKGTNVLIDPGPGSIVRCAAAKRRLDPSKLDAIILTHKHLDHSGDINVMIEAMTEGGFKKRGAVFCPLDALNKNSVILGYVKKFPERIVILKQKEKYKIGSLKFMTSMRHIHPVETYGLKFSIRNKKIALVTDTRYFDALGRFYKSDILIISVVFLKRRADIDHLSLEDAGKIIKKVRPKTAILTHFGMTMLSAKPHIQAQLLSQSLSTEVLAAYDGMEISL